MKTEFQLYDIYDKIRLIKRKIFSTEVFIMKRYFRIISVIIAICLLASTAFALTDRDYKVLMKDKKFAAADRALNAKFKEAKRLLSKKAFARVRNAQSEWIKEGRDAEAKAWMEEDGLSFVDAYTKATREQTKTLENWIQRELYDEED